MAAPTLDKTWQFDVNNLVGSTASVDAAGKAVMYQIKAALVGFGTQPWTVWGSNDGAGNFGNGDLVDRWTDTTKLVWTAAGSNHSWIVLTQSGVATKFSICIDLNNTGSPQQATVVVSPAAGFGLANGGTDGTATARPTASDQIIILNNNVWGLISSAGLYHQVHVMQSTDGDCTRIIICQLNQVCGFWIFDVPKNPISGWSNPSFFGLAGSNTSGSQMTQATWMTTKGNGYIGAAVTFTMTGEGYGGATPQLGQVILFPDDDTGEWPMLGIGFYSLTASHRGRKGQLYDLWWGSQRRQAGDAYPGDGGHDFAQFDHMIVPWNGSIPQVA